METNNKLDYKKTFILGFGFFAISLVWPLYNVYVPLYLEKFISSSTIIGAIMTIDNILAIFMIPFISNLSDNTRTRFGRRMPFIFVGLPLSAILFILLPSTTNSFLLMMIVLTLLNFVMSIYRGPTVALMPDLTPPALRSEANGIINFMGGLAAVVVLIGGSFMYKVNPGLPFWVTGIIMFFSLFMLYKFIKEPVRGEKSAEEKVKVIQSVKDIITNEDNKTMNVLIAILFWFLGYQGMEAMFSRYSVNYLGVGDGGDSSLIIGVFALSFLIFAIPAGFLGAKIGKKKAIIIGLSVDILVFITLSLMGPGNLIPFNKTLMMGLFLIGGIFWACVNINSYPYVVQGVGENKVGTYTGLYYFSSSIAAILGPIIFGFFVDLFGFSRLFVIVVITFIIALFFITRIKSKTVEIVGRKTA